MKVFLASSTWCDDVTIYGVFSTLELAQQACGESTGEWSEGDGGWYREEVWSGPVRVDNPYNDLGWTRTRLLLAYSGHVQVLELDEPHAAPEAGENRDDAQPMTESDEAEWAAYVTEGLRNGTMWSTTMTTIHTTGA